MALLYLCEERRLKRRDAARAPAAASAARGARPARGARCARRARAALGGIVVGLTQLERGDFDAAMVVTVGDLGALRGRARAPPRGRPARPPVRVGLLLGLRARRRRPPRDPLRVVKLALAASRTTSAPVELRERVAIDLRRRGGRSRARARRRGTARRSCSRPATARSSTSPRTTTRRSRERADRALLALAGDDGAALAPVAYRLGRRVGRAAPLPRRRRASTRSCPARARSSARFATRSRPAPPGPLLDRLVPHGAARRPPRAGRDGDRREPRLRPGGGSGARASRSSSGSAGRRVVLVGAGRTSELTARNLRSRGAVVAAVVNRSLERAEELAAALGATRRRARRARRRASRTPTSSSRRRARRGSCSTPTTRSRARFGRAAAGRSSSSTSPSRATSIRRSRRSTAASSTTSTTSRPSSQRRSRAGARRPSTPSGSSPRRPSASRAWQASLAVVPAIASLRARAEEIRAAELARLEARLERLSESERAAVETVTAQIVNKLLHLPTVRLKEAAVTAGRAALC